MTRLLAALGAGTLVAVSLPPWGWWPLTFVGIALFDHLLNGVQDRRVRWVCGTAFGLGWLGPGMGWMWFLTPPGYIIATLGFAAMHGLAATIRPSTTCRPTAQRLLVRPAAHMLVEAVRFVAPFGGVPLASIAMAQSAGPLAGIGRLGGPLAVTWATFAVAVALAIVAARPGLWKVPVLTSTTVVLVAVGAGLVPFTRATGDHLRIAIVQGGGPQGTLAIDSNPADVVQRHLDTSARLDPEQDLDLVLWPENVIATGATPFVDSATLRAVAAEAARLGVPFAVGITERPVPGRFTNAHVVVQPDGTVTSRYDKVRRVPFGEYMPMRPLLAAVGVPVERVPTDAIPGRDPAFLEVAGQRLAVAISWEVFFGGRARDGVGHGGSVLLNPTNGSSYTGTILQTQQIASSRLRAIETGRWVVQAAPTGFSAVITSSGRVVERSAISESRLIIQDIPLMTGRTLYGILGDRPIIGAAIASLVTGVVIGRRRQKTSPADTVTTTLERERR